MIYTLPLPPSGTNNAYHTSNGKWYKDRDIVLWERECLYMLRKKVDLLTGGITVNIGFYFPDNRRRDIDGKIKFVLDLCQKAGFYVDDSEVVNLIVSKRIDKNNPRLEMEVYV